MSDSDEVFLASTRPFEDVAERVAGVLKLEPNGDLRARTGELQYKVRARTSDGVVGVYIGPNIFQPEPDEAQAMDGYGVVVDVQYRTHKPQQAEEARMMYEALTDGLPDVPALLVHNLGTHTFDPLITPDVEPLKASL